MRAATGSQWSSMSSGVMCALFDWLNTRRAAAFWIKVKVKSKCLLSHTPNFFSAAKFLRLLTYLSVNGCKDVCVCVCVCVCVWVGGCVCVCVCGLLWVVGCDFE